jgi:DNA repair exonuclease SbcCD nuclease subunit
MFKFLHAADIHLDSPMNGLGRYEGAPVSECRLAARHALENLVRLAEEEKVAFVLIVGDLYDGNWPDFNTGLFFAKQTARLRDQGIPVILIRGNHDAANAMTRDLKFLDTVKVLNHEAPQSLVLDDLGVAFHGQSFATRAVTENLVRAYPAQISGVLNIGLLHTALDGREGHERYAPCTVDDLRRLEYDYWALGHVHNREILRGSDPYIAFPGNIQGRNIRESGPKGCFLVTVDDARNVSAEPRWLDVMRWATCRVDASNATEGDEIVQRARDRMTALSLDADDRLLALRVEIGGACPAHSAVSADWPYWINEIRRTATESTGGRAWVEKVVSKMQAPEAHDDSEADGPLAELSLFLEELRQDDVSLKTLGDRELDDLRKKLDRSLLDDLDTPDRLRELLDQVGPMLMSRLNGKRAHS